MRKENSKDTNSIVIVVLLLTTIYAIFRYNIFNHVPWSDLPLYVGNKIISFSSIVLLSLALINRKRENTSVCKYLLKTSKAMIFMHVVISLLIINGTFYPKFFDAEKLNLIGQSSMLAGVFALFQLTNMKLFKHSGISKTFGMVQKNGFELLLILIALHLLIMGYSGWFDFSKWPGGMPPISLLSFILCILPFFLKQKIMKN